MDAFLETPPIENQKPPLLTKEILNMLPYPTCFADLNGNVLSKNDGFQEIFTESNIFNIHGPYDPEDLKNFYTQLTPDNSIIQHDHSEKPDDTENLIWYTRNVKAVFDSQGNCLGYTCQEFDTTQQNKDPLTGLHNRAYFMEQLSLRLAQHNRLSRSHPDQTIPPLTAIYLDVDRLKVINDEVDESGNEIGHAKGDIHLKRVAEILKKVLREEDIPSRIGGDEFTALLEILPENMDIIKKRLQEAIDQNNLENPNLPEVSISLGFALYDPSKDRDLWDTFARADKNMYESKESHYAKLDPAIEERLNQVANPQD